jgi:hypothetical protein
MPSEPPEHGEWSHYGDDDDPWAFDEEMRNWIDDPPVGWRPPENKPLLWRVVDYLDTHGWAIRLDAWIDAMGIHMHFRWIVRVFIPDKYEHQQWIDAGQPKDQTPKPQWVISKRGVGGFVVNWFELVMFESHVTDYQDDESNGKGGAIRPHERDE